MPTVVLAETLFGDARDARANQVLKRLQVVPITEPIARVASELKRRAGMTGVEETIDAIVVAVSVASGGGVILTADIDHISKLAESASGYRIRTVRV